MSQTGRVHAFGDDALGTYDAVGLVGALHDGTVSAPEVVEAAVARVTRVHAQLNGVAQPAYDWARAFAAVPRPGWFSGVPTFLKDNIDVQGMSTLNGADAWVGRHASADGDLAHLFGKLGLVPLGKTQLSEFGFSPSAEHPRLGAVRSPWDPTRTAGASSAGSSVMVATGAVPLAHANDGGGSIRIPAAVNGLVGLKPTRGRLPQDKLMRQMPVRIISDGVLTRSVRDTAAFFREAERAYRALHLPPIGDLTRPGKGRLKVALQTTGIGRGASPEVTELTLKTAALLEGLGHRVETVEAPVDPGFPDDFLVYWSTLALFLVRNGRRDHGASWDPDRLDNLTHGLAGHSRRHLHRLPGAIRRLRRTAKQATAFYERYDVTLTPTLATETPLVGHLDPRQDYDVLMDRILDWVSFTPWQNATGAPAISLPLATTSRGLPQGMMFGAAAGREATLIELAYELEEAAPFARIQE